MTDYLLRFPSREYAIAFGQANGFTSPDPDSGEDVSNLASEHHALIVIGEHSVPTGAIIETQFGLQQQMVGDGFWWVLFRDLVGIQIPPGAEQLIVWTSASGFSRPTDPDTPQNQFYTESMTETPKSQRIYSVTAWRIHAMLARAGLTNTVAGMLEALPEPAKFDAKAQFQYATVFQADNAFVVAAASKLGLSVQEFFETAMTVPGSEVADLSDPGLIDRIKAWWNT